MGPSLLQRTPVLWDQGLALGTSFNLTDFLKGPTFKRYPFGGYGFSIWIFWENTIHSIPVFSPYLAVFQLKKKEQGLGCRRGG